MSEINQLIQDEGFRRKPYMDTKGIPTIGYGFTFLTKKESHTVLIMRIERVKKHLSRVLPWYKEQTEEVQNILLNMAYQMGVAGLRKFKKTLAFIIDGKYEKASIEMLDSQWSRNHPNRSGRLSRRMSKCV